jgi:hypothetical protein
MKERLMSIQDITSIIQTVTAVLTFVYMVAMPFLLRPRRRFSKDDPI